MFVHQLCTKLQIRHMKDFATRHVAPARVFTELTSEIWVVSTIISCYSARKRVTSRYMAVKQPEDHSLCEAVGGGDVRVAVAGGPASVSLWTAGRGGRQ